MNKFFRLGLSIVFLLSFAFHAGAQTAPAPSQRYQTWYRVAQEDAKRGVYVFKRLGLVEPSIANFPSKAEYYRSVLADRYHITTDKSIGCIVSEEEVDEVHGYNAGLQAAIETKYGEGFFDRVEREAGAEWEQKYGEQAREYYRNLNRRSSTTTPPTGDMRTVAVAAPSQEPTPQTELKPPAKRKFDYHGKIETQFDAEKNQSMVFFALLPIKALQTPRENHGSQWSDERLEFSAYFVYAGKQFVTPKWVTLAFMWSTENPQKYSNPELRVRADGQWLELGTMKVMMNFTTNRRAQLPLTNQALEWPITYEQLLQMANAKKLKVKLGHVEFDMEKEQLEAIRDLAVHTVP